MKLDEKLSTFINSNYQAMITYFNNDHYPKTLKVAVRVENNDLVVTSLLTGVEIPIEIKSSLLIYQKLKDKDEIDRENYLRIAGKMILNDIFKIHIVEYNRSDEEYYRSFVKSIPSTAQSLGRQNKQIMDELLSSTTTAILLSSFSDITTIIQSNIRILDNYVIEISTSSEKLLSQIAYNPTIKIIPLLKEKDNKIGIFSGTVISIKEKKPREKTIRIELNNFQFGDQSELEYFPIRSNNQNLIQKSLYFIKNKTSYWINALRGGMLLASLFPVLLGVSYSSKDGFSIKFSLLILTILGLLSIQGGANMINDYFDYKSGSDKLAMLSSPFYSGSRYIRRNLSTPDKMIGTGLFLINIGILIGLYLNTIYSNNIILGLGLIGVMLAYFYTALPLKLAHRGLGDIVLFFTFGPLPALGGYYVQTGTISTKIILASVPLSVIVIIISILSDIKSIEMDEYSGKQSLVVKLGVSRSQVLIKALLAMEILLFIVYIHLNIYPVYTIILVTPPIFYMFSKVTTKIDKNDKSKIDNIITNMFFSYSVLSIILITVIII